MDKLGSALYEFKTAVDKVKNVVFQYTELEAKVREATNSDAWGASSSLMQEIAQGTNQLYQIYTHFSRGFNEVMGMLWMRMEDTSGPNWRQVYKV